MGFFDKILQRKTAVQKQQEPDSTNHKIRLEDLSPWLRDAHKNDMDKVYSDAAEISRLIGQAFNLIRSSSIELGKAALTGKTRESNAVNMIKESFVKNASRLQTPAPLPRQPSHLQMTGYHSSASREFAGLLTPKQAFVLNSYFPEQSAPLIESIKAAQRHLDSFSGLSNSVLKNIEKAENSAASIISKKSKVQSLEREMENIEADMAALKESLESSVLELERAERSHEMRTAIGLREQSEQFRGRLNAITEEVARHLPPKKALLKAIYRAEKAGAFSHAESSALKKFAEGPFLIIGSIQLTEIAAISRKAGNTLQDRDLLYTADSIEEEVGLLAEEHNSLSAKIGNLEAEIAGSSVLKRTESLKEDISRLQNAVRNKAVELADSESRLASFSAAVSTEMKSLSDSVLSNFRRRVEIV